MSTGTMRNSGIEWIGDVPAHWEFKRLKYASTLAGRIGWQGLTSEEYRTEGVHLVTGTDFKEGRIDWDNCVRISKARWAEATQVQLQEGDLLITKDGTVGKVAICRNMPNKASLNSGVMVIRQKVPMSTRFLYWVLQSPVFGGWFSDVNAGASTISHLYQADFYNFGFYMPPTTREQEQVAAVLDVETAKIDHAIDLLRQQLETLEQLKKSIIHEAVTKGLDPTVPMKPSGIEWIGDIPEGWGCERLKFMSTLSGGYAFDSQDLVTDYRYPVIRIGDLDNGAVSFCDCVGVSFEEGLSAWQLRPNTVLLAMSGATVGKVSFVGSDIPQAYVNQRVGIIEAEAPKYLYYLLATDAFLSHVAINSMGSAQPNISPADYYRFNATCPSGEEKRAISDYLDAKCETIDKTLAVKREQLELLRRQRGSLIFEYVTGKQRVSEVA